MTQTTQLFISFHKTTKSRYSAPILFIFSLHSSQTPTDDGVHPSRNWCANCPLPEMHHSSSTSDASIPTLTTWLNCIDASRGDGMHLEKRAVNQKSKHFAQIEEKVQVVTILRFLSTAPRQCLAASVAWQATVLRHAQKAKISRE